VSDLFDPDVRDLLDARTAHVEPAPGVLDRVHATVRRRRRRRRMAVGTSALLATSVALAFAGGAVWEPLETGGHGAAVAGGAAVAHLDAVKIRTDLGITGRTKGASTVIVAKSPSPDSDRPSLSLIQTETGFSEPLQGNAASASLSPRESAVAVVTTGNRIVVESTTGTDRTVLRHQRSGANISWDPSGTALFALVDHHWVRVPAPGVAGTVNTLASVRVLGVPRLPGGPSFLSVSPSRDYTILYGVAGGDAPTGHGEANAGTPHLYLGRFDGHRRVSRIARVPVPRTTRHEPMGWLGDNAFVIGTGVGAAWIVRVDGSHVPVAAALPDACSLDGAPTACRARGPRLLGTNAAGSLLYWRVRGVPTLSSSEASEGRNSVVAYFSTWLDGTHQKRLTGPAGTYGPATAAR
jgi:hypothetical protein